MMYLLHPILSRVALFLLLALYAFQSSGQDLSKLPVNAQTNFPILLEQIEEFWPEYELPWVLAGQVEKETCITLKHSKCWSRHAELKTSREFGFGLGQLTIAYKADGSVRFNAWEEVKLLHPALKDWKWEDRKDAKLQLIAVVVRDKMEYARVKGAANPREHTAMFLNSYNGGFGGLTQDRKLCSTKPNCNPAYWFGHVEKYSYKSRVAVKGYGKSFFDISRAYPPEIMDVRSAKYKPFFPRISHGADSKP